MRIVIAGGHGQIALRFGRLLAERGDVPVGIIRNPAQADDLKAAGIEPVVLDLEQADVEAVAAVLTDADAAVFAAGAGPNSGAGRKDTVDRVAAALLADACEVAAVNRYLLVSSMGVETVRGQDADPADDVFTVYLKAKLAAEEDLKARSTAWDLAWTVLRPGGLTDDPGTGRVHLAPSVPSGSVPRDDVATVLLALLDEPLTAGLVLELAAGETLISEAITSL